MAQPPAKDLIVFVHFYKPQVNRLVKEGFVGVTAKPTPATRQWKDTVTTGEAWTMTIPE